MVFRAATAALFVSLGFIALIPHSSAQSVPSVNGLIGPEFTISTNYAGVEHSWYDNLYSAASNGTNFIVLWPEQRTNGVSAIVTSLINTPTNVVVTDVYTIGTNHIPAVASNGKTYLVSWKNENAIRAVEISAGGDVSNTFVVSLLQASVTGIAVASDGTNWLIAYSQAGVWTNGGIFGVLIGADHTVRQAFRISQLDYEDMNFPVLGFNGENYLCAWEFSSRGEGFGARITPNGVVLDTNNIVIVEHGSGWWCSRIASNGDGFLSIWRSGYGPSTAGTRVSATGHIMDTNPVVFYEETRDTSLEPYPSLCYGSGHYIVSSPVVADDPFHEFVEGKILNYSADIVASFSVDRVDFPQTVCANNKGKVLLAAGSKARILDLSRIASVTNSSSFLLQNTNGQVALCSANDTNYLAHLLNKGVSPGVNWKVVDTADFDKDNQIDVLFQHTDGRMAIWFMNGTNVRNAKILHDGKPANAGWKAIAAADFNNNGRPDILFQSTNGPLAVWFMTNDYAGTKLINNGTSPGSGWKAVTAYDVDVYKSGDIILRHTDGSLKVWSMDGVNMLTSTALPKGPSSPTYRIACAGHFTLQSAYDLVWEMPDRRLGTWEMDATNYVRFAWLNNGVPLPSGWHVVARR